MRLARPSIRKRLCTHKGYCVCNGLTIYSKGDASLDGPQRVSATAVPVPPMWPQLTILYLCCICASSSTDTSSAFALLVALIGRRWPYPSHYKSLRWAGPEPRTCSPQRGVVPRTRYRTSCLSRRCAEATCVRGEMSRKWRGGMKCQLEDRLNVRYLCLLGGDARGGS